MSCMGFLGGGSPVHRLDPRVRVAAAALLSIPVALAAGPGVPAMALVAGCGLAVAARLPEPALLRRLGRLNLFVLFLWLMLPWSTPGTPAGTIAGLGLTHEGVELALLIALKANAIVLLFTSLVATVPPAELGYALRHLGLSDKLVHLFLFAIRYTDVIHGEYERLRGAMRARAFRANFSLHTLRTFGYLVGLLLVRSLDRAERVLAAMKCRGFDGRFRSLTPFAMRPADWAFLVAGSCAAGGLTWMILA
ncbi:MAG: cobalt ECF transporter T component CbiQ [Verrucomicrobia bacterium]|nr:cobalt ECF transporter T component CbiQ [Verrucomicrobiota bacterium]